MNTQRLILFFVFSFSLLLLWDAWQRDHRPPVAPVVQSAKKGPAQALVPSPSVPAEATPAAPHKPGVAAPEKASLGTHGMVTVKTDNFIADIDLQGGDIVRLELRKQKDTLDQNANFQLFTPAHHYAAQSGLIGPGLPTHKAIFRADASEYVLGPGQDELQVRLEAP